MKDLIVFSGSSHPSFAREICGHLEIPLGEMEIFKFSNENILPKIKYSVRGKDVFVIQTQSSPLSDNIMEMLLIVRTLRQSSAARITVVMPYMPYSRSDKKDQPRVCIGARLIADLIEQAGANRFMTMDLHSPQIQGFFSIPVDQLVARPVIVDYLKQFDLEQFVAVAADFGEAHHIGSYANRLNNMPTAIIDKKRIGNDEEAVPVDLKGSVEGKIAIIFDDEIASGKTLIKGAKFLVEQKGAKEVWGAVVHPVLSGRAIPLFAEASFITRLLVTNTIPIPKEKMIPKILQLSVAPLFAEAIRRVHNEDSVDALFR